MTDIRSKDNYRAVISYGEERVGNNPNCTGSLTVPKKKRCPIILARAESNTIDCKTLTISRREKMLGREKERKEEAEQDILQEFRNSTRIFQMIVQSPATVHFKLSLALVTTTINSGKQKSKEYIHFLR